MGVAGLSCPDVRVLPGQFVGQHDDLEIAVSLLLERGKALAQHPRVVRARDDNRHERLLLERRRNLDLRVVLEKPETVEDRKRVHHHALHRGRLEASELLAELERDRRLGNLRAASVGNRKQLKVEGKGLHEHPVKRRAENLPAEKLHPHLCVRDGQPHENPHERVVYDAREPAVPGILHVGLRVALRAKHYVRTVLRHRIEEVGDSRGQEVEVAVEQEHEIARGRPEAFLERIALSRVHSHEHRLHARISGGSGLDPFGSVVGTSVVYRHDLVVDFPLKYGRDLLDVPGNRPAKAVRRHDDAETPFSEHLPRRLPLVVLIRDGHTGNFTKSAGGTEARFDGTGAKW